MCRGMGGGGRECGEGRATFFCGGGKEKQQGWEAGPVLKGEEERDATYIKLYIYFRRYTL